MNRQLNVVANAEVNVDGNFVGLNIGGKYFWDLCRVDAKSRYCGRCTVDVVLMCQHGGDYGRKCICKMKDVSSENERKQCSIHF